MRYHRNAAKGSRNGRAKLDEEKVRYIRQHYRYAGKDTTKSNSAELAAKFNVSQNAINAAYHGYTWGWLD